jgi:hypothetical protein
MNRSRFDVSDWRRRGFWIAHVSWIIPFGLLALGAGSIGWGSSGTRMELGSVGLGMLLSAASFVLVAREIARNGPLRRPVDVVLGPSRNWKLGLNLLAVLSVVIGLQAAGPLNAAERDRDLQASEHLRFLRTVTDDAFADAAARWDSFTDGPISAELRPDHAFEVRISAPNASTTVWSPEFGPTPGSVRFRVDAKSTGEGWYGLFCHRQFRTDLNGGPKGSTFFSFLVHTSGLYRIAARFADAEDQILTEGRLELRYGDIHTLAVECVERIAGGPVVLTLSVDGTMIVRRWRGAGIGGAGIFGVLATATSDAFQVRFARLRAEEIAYPD